MAKRKPTPNQAEYQRNINRIKRFVRNAEKRGYSFDLSGIDLKMPGRVTKKALREIKQIRPARLYQMASYNDPISRETFTGEQGRQIENYRRSKKAAQTVREKKAGTYKAPQEKPKRQKRQSNEDIPSIVDIVLSNVEEMLETWTPHEYWTHGNKKTGVTLADIKRKDRNIAKSILEGAISTYGREVVAQRLEEHAEEVNQLLDQILYGSGDKNVKNGREQAQFALVRFSAIVSGRLPSVKESMELTELTEAEDFDEWDV